ncbi:hypothetical protein [Achromobacter sp. AONIH1]|uniref:hypothetical protein n=1 Tax=Achromobacter sp. AONIH1 TaxID=1758194 RepID=UPI000CD00FB1|nr:hypothetical protein [Achromobacter sp. AONIH1]AUT47027.1 hypothetical protein C2U31_14115 [Achromobacter sp. AONIH1]
MNEIVAARAEQSLTPLELGSMSTQQLRERLAQSLTMTAKHLVYLAAIWNELEKRGEDLNDLRVGLASYLPHIAAGRLDADAVIRFAGQPAILKSIAALPVNEQREMAYGKPVRVLSIDGTGAYTEAEIPAYALTASQARIVFSGDKLRTPVEQQALIESAKLAKARRVIPGSKNKVRYDPAADVLRIGRSSATVGEVMSALASHASDAGDTPSEDMKFSALVRLTEEEHRMLHVRAAESGHASAQKLMRAILKKYLLI